MTGQGKAGNDVDKKPGDLSDISETLLVTLYCRAVESETRDPIIVDRKACEIARKLDERLAASPIRMHRMLANRALPRYLPANMSLRARDFDRYVQEFLSKAPDGAIVNMGCGLDSRCFRVDNGQALWFNLDLPEVIEFRRQFLEETDRYRSISSSVLDFSWMDGVKAAGRRDHMFMAEGLLMYFHEDQVKALVLELLRRFPGSELVAEVTSSWIVRMLHGPFGRGSMQRKIGFARGVTFSFGVDSGDHFERWDPRIEFLDERFYCNETERKLGWLRHMVRFRKFKYAQWIVHYRLG